VKCREKENRTSTPRLTLLSRRLLNPGEKRPAPRS
jgi:hypothetical protein